jgi:phosphohistidine phosphatase
MTKSEDNRYQLFVLRHGKASDEMFGRDFDRSLTDKGIKQAEKIGEWMSSQSLKPDFVITSPAKRALMTTQLVTRKLNVEPQNIQVASQIYDADLDALLEVLANCPSSNHNVLLVGHNPSLEYLVDCLLSKPITSVVTNDDRMLPATLVHLEMNISWSQLTANCAKLVSISHGKFLP